MKKPTGLSPGHLALFTASDDTKRRTVPQASVTVIARTNLEQADCRSFENVSILGDEKNYLYYSKQDHFLGGTSRSIPGLELKEHHILADFAHEDAGTGILTSSLFGASLIYSVDKSTTEQFRMIKSSIGHLDRLNRVGSTFTYWARKIFGVHSNITNLEDFKWD